MEKGASERGFLYEREHVLVQILMSNGAEYQLDIYDIKSTRAELVQSCSRPKCGHQVLDKIKV